jgi:hypothetical protein
MPNSMGQSTDEENAGLRSFGMKFSNRKKQGKMTWKQHEIT